MRKEKIFIEGQETQYEIYEDGTIWNIKRNSQVKGTTKRNEYQTVYLSLNGKQYCFMVHRLVAQYFCENPNNYTIVHHKDGNKLNNKANNLEWTTAKENAKEKFQHKNSEQINFSYENGSEWKPLSFNNNYLICPEGFCYSKKSNKVLLGQERNGYKRIFVNGKHYSIHRLVYEIFSGEIPDKMEIDHIDGNKSNNRIENLRLTSRKENMLFAMQNGHAGQIPILQYDLKGNFIQEYPTIQAAADAMGVTHAAVRSAMNRQGTCHGYKWKKKES